MKLSIKKLFTATFLLIGFCLAILILPNTKSEESLDAETVVREVGGLDLIATGLEITQGTQSLLNSVRLVAGKATFVRFYVQSNGNNAVTTARLTVTRGANSIVLNPINPGLEINVLQNPNRAILNQAFLF